MQTTVIVALCAIPLALCVWLLWSMRGFFSQNSSEKFRAPPRPNFRVQKVTAHNTVSSLPMDDVSKPTEMCQRPIKAIAQHLQGPTATTQFIKGERYIFGMRVFECLGFRGKKDRRAGFYDFGELEYWPQKRNDDADNYFWFSIRTDDGVEVCDRGRIRADNVATNERAQEYAREVKELHDGERAYWAERKAKRERDAKRLAELERLVKENNLE